MDPLLWLAGAVIVAVLLLSIPFIQNFFTRPPEQPREQEPEFVVGGARRRPRVNNVDNDIDETTAGDEDDKQMKKIGTKKMIKLRAKAEKKALREQEEAFREDVKKREALRQEELKKQEEEEEEQKKKEEQEEIEKRLQLEREEHEQYLELKASFVVEEEGYMREEDESKSIKDFIQYIKENKVVFLEDLAAEFNMRTQDVIARVQSLQESRQLTGVIDDRGKFIYISVQELEGVAKFIRQRGRVSLSELAQSSNTLINLQPTAI